MDFSFIHVSDIHLGRPFSGLSKFSGCESDSKIYKNAVERAFNNLVNFAISKNVDFVLIAGDTFDSSESDFSSKLILKNNLKQLDDAGISVFMIAGNHDPIYTYSKNTFNYDKDSKIKIIGLNTPINVKLPLLKNDGTMVGYIHALSFQEEKFSSNPMEYFEPADEKLFNIGLLHCDLNADSSSNYAPCSLSDLKSKNYNYWALGHIHIPTGNEDCIGYSGTIQGRNTKETGPHGIKYVKVQNNNIIENSFIPMDVVRYEDISIDFSSIEDITDAINLIEEEINSTIRNSESFCSLYLIELKLYGSVSFYSEVNNNLFELIHDKLLTNSSNRIYLSQIDNALTPKIDESLLREDDGISGELYKIVSNNKVLQDCYFKTLSQFKNIKVNTSDIDSITDRVKKDGISLCSLIYDDNNEA